MMCLPGECEFIPILDLGVAIRWVCVRCGYWTDEFKKIGFKIEEWR